MTGDIAGVPVSDAARWRVQSWSPEDFDVTEWACRPHAWDYSLEGPLSALRIWADIDQATQKVIAYHGHLNMQEQETTIWMDGRPHPPANALHTWSGFSTGEWDGDVARRDDDAPQGSVPAPLGADAERSGHDAHPLAAHGRLPAGDRRSSTTR